MSAWPHVDADLASYLDRAFPDTLPPKDATLEDLRFLQGQRDVVDKVLGAVRRQERKTTRGVT